MIKCDKCKKEMMFLYLDEDFFMNVIYPDFTSLRFKALKLSIGEERFKTIFFVAYDFYLCECGRYYFLKKSKEEINKIIKNENKGGDKNKRG